MADNPLRTRVFPPTSDTDYLFSQVEIKTIRLITVGVFIRLMTGSQPPILEKHEIATDIKPGASRLIDTFGLSLKQARGQANGMKSSSVSVEFGILEVRFDDGSSWHSTAEDDKGFKPQTSSAKSSLTRTAGSVVCGRTKLSTSCIRRFVGSAPITSKKPNVPKFLASIMT
jgi:hypothetical protein